MTLAAIVATDLHNAIGKNNKLLWHLPADLRFFKTTTMGCPVIMGRKTYESIGRLLPGRTNIIISRNAQYRVEGALVYPSLETALENTQAEKVFVIGGAEIYRLCFGKFDEIYRTLVKQQYEADTFFPELENSVYTKEWEECHAADEKNAVEYCFQKWVKSNS